MSQIFWVGGKFVAVSWIAESIHMTINYEGIICPLTPLIITLLFSDTNPKQAAALIATRLCKEKKRQEDGNKRAYLDLLPTSKVQNALSWQHWNKYKCPKHTRSLFPTIAAPSVLPRHTIHKNCLFRHPTCEPVSL
jgi:hypothetical protein